MALRLEGRLEVMELVVLLIDSENKLGFYFGYLAPKIHIK